MLRVGVVMLRVGVVMLRVGVVMLRVGDVMLRVMCAGMQDCRQTTRKYETCQHTVKVHSHSNPSLILYIRNSQG